MRLLLYPFVLAEHFKSAWLILRRNKLRSLLTMLGIIIGIMSVMVIVSVGAGAQSLLINQIKSLGSNLVGVLPGKSDDSGPPAAVFGVVITTLTHADGEAILASGDSHIEAVASYVKGADTVEGGETTADATFVGTTASYPNVETVTIQAGRFFSFDEAKGSARVAVLGSAVADELFPGEGPIGKFVKIKRTNFLIIGVLAERGLAAFQEQDNQIFVPITAAQKLLLGIRHVSFMRVKIDAAEHVEPSMETIRAVLRERHGIDNPDQDDFSVRSMNQGLAAITGVTNGLRFFLAAIAALSLLVGGLGIMNIMLAAVEERTREIGLRQAVGARRRDIMTQFLVETSVLTVTGGIIGIVGGVLVAILVASIARQLGYQWDLVISFPSIVVGTVISVAVGLLFGLSPARRAAALNPIEALRYE